MRFFIDGRMDIRPLRAEDVAHEPLPYNYKMIMSRNLESIADTAPFFDSFDDSDWGENKDFYVDSLQIEFGISPEGYIKYYHGLSVLLYEDDGVFNYNIFGKTYNPLTNPAIRSSETSGALFYRFYRLNRNKIDVDNDLIIVVNNYSGKALIIGGIVLTIAGVVI